MTSTPNQTPRTPNRTPQAPPTRALSIAEPWAYLIAAGFKPIENRTWQTGYRGTIAIHASKSRGHFADEPMMWQLSSYDSIYKAIDDSRISDDTPLFHFGAIIGTVDIVDVVEFDQHQPNVDAAAARQFARFEYLKAGGPAHDVPLHQWAEGPFCFMLANPRRFANPIPCTGKLSLWGVSPELQAAIARASRHVLTDPGQPAVILPTSQAATTPPAESAKLAADENRRAVANEKKRQKLLGVQPPWRRSI